MSTVVSTPRHITTIVTAGATLAKGRHTPVNATSGPITMVLPTGAAEGVVVSVEKTDSSANAVTLSGSIRGTGSSTLTLAWQYESITLTADSAGSWWPTAGHKTKTSIDAAITAGTTGKADSSTVSAHIADTANPHAVTKAQVGLGSVNNTADSAKPVSTAQQAALDLKAPLASPTFTGTVAGITKSMVGLGSVDNTADTAKPVSTAQQTALDAKASVVENVNTVATSGSAVTLPDVTTATIHDVTLTANCTFTFPTVAAGKSFTLRLTQDATGSRTVTWPASVKWSQAIAPVLSTGTGKQDVLTFISVGGSTWSGFLAGLDMR